MYLSRDAEEIALRLAAQYPILAITGPRQSGKTTLARHLFPDRDYVSLEDLDERAFATDDPRGFLARFPDGAVFDEIQRVPSLFSYLQTEVDSSSRMGRFILTGSHHYDLITGITQSLAGRAAFLTLLPFSLGELQRVNAAPGSLDEMLFAGFYPPIHDRGLDPGIWYDNYVRTYVERDVRQIVNVRDLSSFQRFVKLCAARTGQLLNYSDLAADAGITHTTARAWISVLEASYVLHLLQPHHRNFNKRLIKTPKLYFLDTGLACRLLGIDNAQQLAIHAQRGALFETLVVSELMKTRLHRARRPNIYFWRDRAGTEIDVLVEEGPHLHPIEIKSGRTIARDFTTHLMRWVEWAGASAGAPTLVYGGDESFTRSGVRYVGWRDLPEVELSNDRPPQAQ